MKSILRLVILLLVVALLSGCFSVSTIINLNKNGSGTIEEKILVKPMDMFGQSQQEPKSIYDEEDLISEAANYGEGVIFVRGQELSENGMNGYLAVYEFEDINKLQLNQNFAGKAVDLNSFPGAQEEINEYITFNFKSGSTSTLNIIYPEEFEIEESNEDMELDEQPEMTEEDEEMIDMMKELYDGMKFSMKINFNGKIKKTNASYQEGNTVILMDVDFGKLTEDTGLIKKMSQAGNMTQAEMQELMKKAEGMKVETQRELTVDFN